MYFIGIDCGKHGAIGIINDQTNLATAVDIPTTKILLAKKRKADKNRYKVIYLEDECVELMLSITDDPSLIKMVTIEHQQVMGEEGRVSCFEIGYGYALWVMYCAARGLPREVVRPADWKPRILPVGAPKDLSRAKASILFPNAEPLLLRVQDHDRAEAILLAEDGRRRYKERNR